MLVLRRKRDQSLVLKTTADIPAGSIIRMVVTDVARSYASIGIDAPPAIQILRGELTPHDSPGAATGQPDLTNNLKG